MERSFIVSEESRYGKNFNEYVKMAEQQKKFIDTFFKEKGIKTNEYRVGGNGSCNSPFNEDDKSDIRLSIIPTEEDLTTYGKYLTKPDEYGLCYFKKNSKIAKEFSQRCVDEQIVINLYIPRVSDYFKSLGYYGGCSRQQFEYKSKLYLKVEGEYLRRDDTPEGFEEIKLSEYYLMEEEYEEMKNQAQILYDNFLVSNRVPEYIESVCLDILMGKIVLFDANGKPKPPKKWKKK